MPNKHAQAARRPLLSDSHWLSNVDAGRLLDAYFMAALAIDYRKTEHGAQLFQWIMGNEAAFLAPLRKELGEALRQWRDLRDNHS